MAAEAGPTGAGSPWLPALILAGKFMATLDGSIVNLAARTTQSDLHASGPALQVIVAGTPSSMPCC
jgi:hypothetical protein